MALFPQSVAYVKIDEVNKVHVGGTNGISTD